MTRRIAFLVPAIALGALLGGCSGDGSAGEKVELVNVVVRGSAESAAREAGVDLEGLVRDAVEDSLARLPFTRPTRLEVKVDPSQAIPDVGYGGFTHHGGLVSVWVEDPLRPGAETWVPALVAHELHHVSRIRTGPGYGDTLGEALVSEGLADHFAREAFPELPPFPWDEALSRAQERSLWRRAQEELTVPGGYDHQAWFFGAGSLPQYAGYTLGYRIVDAYLGDDGRASEAVDVEASTVIAPYRRQRR